MERARAEGFELVGVCRADPPESIEFLRGWISAGFAGEMHYMARSLDQRADLNSVLPGVKSVLMVGLNMYQDVAWAPGEPKIARYAQGRDYHRVIRGKLARVAKLMTEDVGGEWRAATDSAPIMERELAMRAGLGWFGKNTMLINSHRGSWFMIGSLLTTVEFEPTPSAAGGCGTCRACIDACPTGAIVFRDDRWQVDSRRCISYLTIEKRGAFSAEEEAMVGEWTFGCDVCQEVCPFNQPRDHQPIRAKSTGEPDFLARRSWPDLEQLSQIASEEWDELTRGSAVRRTGLEGLRRNAVANLRNQSLDEFDEV